MMSSYIIGVESQGHRRFEEKIPTIFQIQDYIEKAWDLGLNAQGRVETGGILGTRKYIGTPDVSETRSKQDIRFSPAPIFNCISDYRNQAQAMFCFLGIA